MPIEIGVMSVVSCFLCYLSKAGMGEQHRDDCWQVIAARGTEDRPPHASFLNLFLISCSVPSAYEHLQPFLL